MQAKKAVRFASWYAKSVVLKHRGKVFGSDYFVDKGHEVVWENVAIIVLVALLVVSLLRFAAKLKREKRRRWRGEGQVERGGDGM